MKKRVLFCFEVLLIMIFMYGCRKNTVDEGIQKGANEIVDMISREDVRAVTALMFGDDAVSADDEIKNYEGISTDITGVIPEFLAKDSITVKEIDKENQKVVYKITAPDMSRFFTELKDNAEDMTVSDFALYLFEYIGSANKKAIEVSLDYTYENDVFTCNYADPQFVNAITGGLLDAYTVLYQEMINEYLEEVGE